MKLNIFTSDLTRRPHRPFSSQRSFCWSKSAANLRRKESSPAGVHLFALHHLSGFSVPTDPRQYKARQLHLLSQLVLLNHPGQKWTWKCCLCGWVKPGNGSYTPYRSQGHTQTTLWSFEPFVSSASLWSDKNQLIRIYSFANIQWCTYICFLLSAVSYL